MKIKYNEIENTLKIDDGLGAQSFIINTMLILTLINAVMNLYLVLNEEQKSMFGFIYIILGVFATGVLLYRYLKKTSINKIKLSDIESLHERDILGRRKFSLRLKSGKFRDMPELIAHDEIANLRKILLNISV